MEKVRRVEGEGKRMAEGKERGREARGERKDKREE